MSLYFKNEDIFLYLLFTSVIGTVTKQCAFSAKRSAVRHSSPLQRLTLTRITLILNLTLLTILTLS